MKIIGHQWIESERFVNIYAKDEIERTISSSILLFEINTSIGLIHYCQEQELAFAVSVNSITEAIFAHNLNAHYIFVSSSMAKEIQSIAQHYLFDAQIVVIIKNEDEIEQYAQMGIDGVVFPSAITKVH